MRERKSCTLQYGVLVTLLCLALPMVSASAWAYRRPAKSPAVKDAKASESVSQIPQEAADTPVGSEQKAALDSASSDAFGDQSFDEEGSWESGGGSGLGLDFDQEQTGTITLSLDDCIRIALEQNAKIKAAGQDIEASKGQLTEAKAAFWPVMEYKYRMAPVPTDVDDAFNKFFEGEVTLYNGIHVGIGMPVLTFGQLMMAKKLAQGGLEAARIRGRQTEEQVIYQVKQLYYGVQLGKEIVKILGEALGQLNNRISDEEAMVEPGMNPFDLLRLRGFSLELERQKELAEQNLELAYEGIRVQLNLEPGVTIELDSENLRPQLASLDDVEGFADAGMTYQPESRLLDIGVETKRRLYKLEKYKLFPKGGFGFFVDVGRSAGPITGLQLTDDFNDPFNYTRAGVGLQFEGTIDFHGAAGRIKKARAEYYKASYERLIARSAIRLDVRKAFLEAKRAQREVSRTKKEESLARQMMFLAKVNMDVGLDGRDDFTEALKSFLLARGKYFKSVYDYNLALADLEQRVGRERYRSFVPKPDVQVYDAFEYDSDDDGFITLDTEGDTYGRETEDGGTIE